MHSLPYLLEQRRTVRQSLSCNGLLVSQLGTLRGSEALGSCCTSLAFCPDDDGRPKLIVGDETSRLQLWCPDYGGGTLANAFDTGHTGSILCARFLVGTGGSKLICSSTDRQVRLVDLHRRATRPFLCHRARVRALASVNPDVFLSASEDGTVRLYDVRLVGGGRSGAGGPDPHCLLVEQRCERAARSSLRISINSLAVSPLAPHLFATGGGDPFARLYDMRMLRGSDGGPGQLAPTGSAHGQPAWVSAFAPHSLCTPSVVAGSFGGFSSLGRVRHLTGVAFAAAGQHLLLSYSGDAIYAMDTKEHAMSFEQMGGRLRQQMTAAAPAGDASGGSPTAASLRGAPAAWDFTTPPRRMGNPAAAATAYTDDNGPLLPPPLVSSRGDGIGGEVNGGDSVISAAREAAPLRPRPRPRHSDGLAVQRDAGPGSGTAPAAAASVLQPVPLSGQRQRLGLGRLAAQPAPRALLLQPPRLQQPPPPQQQQLTPRPPLLTARERTLLSMALPGAATMTVSAGLGIAEVPPDQRQQQQVREQSLNAAAAAWRLGSGAVGADSRATSSEGAGSQDAVMGGGGAASSPRGVRQHQRQQQFAWYRYTLSPSGAAQPAYPGAVPAAPPAAQPPPSLAVAPAAAAAAAAFAASTARARAVPAAWVAGAENRRRDSGTTRRLGGLPAGVAAAAPFAPVEEQAALPPPAEEEGLRQAVTAHRSAGAESGFGEVRVGSADSRVLSSTPMVAAAEVEETAETTRSPLPLSGPGPAGGRSPVVIASAFQERMARRGGTDAAAAAAAGAADRGDAADGDVDMTDVFSGEALAATPPSPPPLSLPSLLQPLLQSYHHRQAQLLRRMERVSQLTERLAEQQQQALRVAARQHVQQRLQQHRQRHRQQQQQALVSEQQVVHHRGGNASANACPGAGMGEEEVGRGVVSERRQPTIRWQQEGQQAVAGNRGRRPDSPTNDPRVVGNGGLNGPNDADDLLQQQQQLVPRISRRRRRESLTNACMGPPGENWAGGPFPGSATGIEGRPSAEATRPETDRVEGLPGDTTAPFEGGPGPINGQPKQQRNNSGSSSSSGTACEDGGGSSSSGGGAAAGAGAGARSAWKSRLQGAAEERQALKRRRVRSREDGDTCGGAATTAATASRPQRVCSQLRSHPLAQLAPTEDDAMREVDMEEGAGAEPHDNGAVAIGDAADAGAVADAVAATDGFGGSTQVQRSLLNSRQSSGVLSRPSPRSPDEDEDRMLPRELPPPPPDARGSGGSEQEAKERASSRAAMAPPAPQPPPPQQPEAAQGGGAVATSATASITPRAPRVNVRTAPIAMGFQPHRQRPQQQRQHQQRQLFWTRFAQNSQQRRQQQQQQSQQRGRVRSEPVVWNSLLASVAQLEVAAAAASTAAAMAMRGGGLSGRVRGTQLASGWGPPLPLPSATAPLAAAPAAAAAAANSAPGTPAVPRVAVAAPAGRADTTPGTPAAATVTTSSALRRNEGYVLTPDSGRDSAGAGSGGGNGAGGGGGGFLRCFDGHKNVMTIKEVAWLGGPGCGPSYVVSGSDDGHVFMWDYATAEIVRMLPVQEHVIPTCLAVHSSEPMLAGCGNGSVVNVWAPGGAGSSGAAAAAVVEAEAEDGGEGRAEAHGGRGARQRAVVAANREDLHRRRAAAEGEAAGGAADGGRSRPVGAGWAAFAAGIRDRTADVTAATGLLAAAAARTELGALAAAARPATAAATAAGDDSAGNVFSPAARNNQQSTPPPRIVQGMLQPPRATDGNATRAGQVLRLSTALERHRRRSGSPEETIPAFGLTPPSAIGGGGLAGRGVGGDDDGGGGGVGGGRGDAGHEVPEISVSPRVCRLM